MPVFTREEWHARQPAGLKPLWPTLRAPNGYDYPSWARTNARPPVHLHGVADVDGPEKKPKRVVVPSPAHLTFPAAYALDLAPSPAKLASHRDLLMVDSETGSTFKLECQLYHRPGLTCGGCTSCKLQRPCLAVSWSRPSHTGKYPRIKVSDGQPEDITLDSCWDCLIDGRKCDKVGYILDGPRANKATPPTMRHYRSLNDMLGIPARYSILTTAMQKARGSDPSSSRKRKPETPLETPEVKRRIVLKVGSSQSLSPLASNTNHSPSTTIKISQSQSPPGKYPSVASSATLHHNAEAGPSSPSPSSAPSTPPNLGHANEDDADEVPEKAAVRAAIAIMEAAAAAVPAPTAPFEAPTAVSELASESGSQESNQREPVIEPATDPVADTSATPVTEAIAVPPTVETVTQQSAGESAAQPPAVRAAEQPTSEPAADVPEPVKETSVPRRDETTAPPPYREDTAMANAQTPPAPSPGPQADRAVDIPATTPKPPAPNLHPLFRATAAAGPSNPAKILQPTNLPMSDYDLTVDVVHKYAVAVSRGVHVPGYTTEFQPACDASAFVFPHNAVNLGLERWMPDPKLGLEPHQNGMVRTRKTRVTVAMWLAFMYILKDVQCATCTTAGHSCVITNWITPAAALGDSTSQTLHPYLDACLCCQASMPKVADRLLNCSIAGRILSGPNAGKKIVIDRATIKHAERFCQDVDDARIVTTSMAKQNNNNRKKSLGARASSVAAASTDSPKPPASAPPRPATPNTSVAMASSLPSRPDSTAAASFTSAARPTTSENRGPLPHQTLASYTASLTNPVHQRPLVGPAPTPPSIPALPTEPHRPAQSAPPPLATPNLSLGKTSIPAPTALIGAGSSTTAAGPRSTETPPPPPRPQHSLSSITAKLGQPIPKESQAAAVQHSDQVGNNVNMTPEGSLNVRPWPSSVHIFPSMPRPPSISLPTAQSSEPADKGLPAADPPTYKTEDMTMEPLSTDAAEAQLSEEMEVEQGMMNDGGSSDVSREDQGVMQPAVRVLPTHPEYVERWRLADAQEKRETDPHSHSQPAAVIPDPGHTQLQSELDRVNAAHAATKADLAKANERIEVLRQISDPQMVARLAKAKNDITVERDELARKLMLAEDLAEKRLQEVEMARKEVEEANKAKRMERLLKEESEARETGLKARIMDLRMEVEFLRQ